jgi:hypothetical protein
VPNVFAPFVGQGRFSEQGQDIQACCQFLDSLTKWLTRFRKLIQCALSRQDYAAAREAFNKMSDAGKDEPATRYLLYKVGVQSGDMDLGAYRDALVRLRTDNNSFRVPGCGMS